MKKFWLSVSLLLTPCPTPKQFYHRLGGYDAIGIVSDDFIARLAEASSPSVFSAARVDSQKTLRQWTSSVMPLAAFVFTPGDMKMARLVLISTKRTGTLR